jgi:hypothetical protein
MSMGSDYVSKLRPPTDLLFTSQVIYKHGQPLWDDIDRRTRGTRRKTCPSATLSIISPTWTGQGPNLGLRGERSPTNHLRCDTHGLETPLAWSPAVRRQRDDICGTAAIRNTRLVGRPPHLTLGLTGSVRLRKPTRHPSEDSQHRGRVSNWVLSGQRLEPDRGNTTNPSRWPAKVKAEIRSKHLVTRYDHHDVVKYRPGAITNIRNGEVQR